MIEFTVKLDVTNLIQFCKNEKYNFNAYLMYVLYQEINKIENFRFDKIMDEYIMWDKRYPTFNIFNEESETFSTLCNTKVDSYEAFEDEYYRLIKMYKNSTLMVPQEELPPNTFSVSNISWLHYDHFSTNSEISLYVSLSTLITVGKYQQYEEKILMPLTVQAPHAIVDGFHISKLFNSVKEFIRNMY